MVCRRHGARATLRAVIRPGPALLLLSVVAAALPGAAAAENPRVRMTTSLGAFDLELCAEASAICAGDAPLSVANFLRYVDEDVYPPGTFIDLRSAGPATLIVQGGTFHAGQEPGGEYFFDFVPAFDPIPLEVGRGLSNLRGTIAVARDPAVLASGTTGWFLNLTDNAAFDTSSGGYAVFGEVVAGMDVVDAIGAVPLYPFCAGSTPLLDYPGCPAPAVPHLVYVTSIERVPEPGIAGFGACGVLALAWLRRRRPAASVRRADYLPRP